MDADELEIALPTESQLQPCLVVKAALLVPTCFDITPLYAKLAGWLSVCLSVCLSV